MDLGLPVVSMEQMLSNVAQRAGQDEEFNHKFFLRVKDMVNAGDADGLHKEKIPIKLLRLNPACADGFILTDFPNSIAQAEQLEEYRGGLNAYVNLSLPDDILVEIERVRQSCTHCKRNYYTEDVIDESQGIRIEKFLPKDGICDDCGNNEFEFAETPDFHDQIKAHREKSKDLLAFYNTFGNLVDFEVRGGYADYEKLKRQIQFNLKH